MNDPLDRHVQGLGASFAILTPFIAGAQTHERDRAFLVTMNYPEASLNFIVTNPGVTKETLDELYAELTAPLLPHGILCRPGSEDVVEALASERGLVLQERPSTFMAASSDAGSRAALDTSPLVIERVYRDEFTRYCDVVTAGFSMHRALAEHLAPPRAFDNPLSSFYLGLCDGVPVATGLGVLADDCAGVFNISTLPDYRGRGFGAAITARCVVDGFAHGATHAVLQASPMGEPVYERLGFTMIERWRVYASTPTSTN